jgi:hypothetical protein
MTDSASHPNAFVVFIVGLAEPSSMPDDRVVLANGTSPRQEVEGDHPGSMLSFASGSAIKRITAGVKARPLVLPARITPATGLHPPGVLIVERKKESCSELAAASPSLRTLAGIKRLRANHATQLKECQPNVRVARLTDQRGNQNGPNQRDEDYTLIWIADLIVEDIPPT